MDLVLSVNDVKAFHQANFLLNKKHYPATSKLFKVKLVTWFQHYGAKVHYNYIPMVDEEVCVPENHLFRVEKISTFDI